MLFKDFKWLQQGFLSQMIKLGTQFKSPCVSGLNKCDKAFKFSIENFVMELPYKLKTYYFENLHGDMGQI
jgi:hypothetical protein